MDLRQSYWGYAPGYVVNRVEIEHWLDHARNRLSQRLIGFGRHEKRALLVTCDIAVLSVALWLGFSLRYGFDYRLPDLQFSLLTASVPLLGVADT